MSYRNMREIDRKREYILKAYCDHEKIKKDHDDATKKAKKIKEINTIISAV